LIVLRIHHRPRHRRRPSAAVRPHLEALESRCLLSGPGSLSPDALFHETLDAALDLRSLALVGQVNVGGAIGAGPHGAADVNWYRFELSATTEVRLTAFPGAGGHPLLATLTLYSDSPYDPFNPIDPYTPDGHRLLAQDDAGNHLGYARIDRLLGPGNYWVAVSGSGNDYFDPFLADSGLNGRTGSYRLSVATSDPGPAYDDLATPVVLAADPAPGAVLSASPFALRFDLNAPVDPYSIFVGQDPSDTAQLWFSTVKDFSSGSAATQVDLSLATVSLEQNADGNNNELHIALVNPLPAGYYQAILKGYGPGGTDYVVQFQITGPVGNTDPARQPGDSIFTAYEIPNAADGRLHQVGGAVGVDPTDPAGFDPSAVQFYHFSISGPGLYAFDAEVFAGRIGSPLLPAPTLYRVDASGQLEFVASNGGTGNQTLATDGLTPPLANDPALLLSLSRGDYYLAVSSGLDFPDPLDPTRTGVFDPLTPQSATAGNSTGPYVLNLLLQPAGPAPRVVAVKADTSPAGNEPLAGVQVRFSQPVNLHSLTFEAFQQSLAQTGTACGALASATLTDVSGKSYDLRLESYDDATNTATFILLDAVPPGTYTLRLSGAGPLGITNVGGVPLAGNVAGTTDFVTTLVSRGAASGTTAWSSLPGFGTPDHAQPIGVLFPVSLSNGITITRDASAGAGTTEDDYSFQVLQSRQYSLAVTGDSLPPGLTLTFINTTAGVTRTYIYDPLNPSTVIALPAGTYTLRATWSGGVGAYALTLSISGSAENPVSLVVGSGPALRARLLTSAPDTAPPPALVLNANSAPPPVAAAATTSFLPLAGFLTLPGSPLVAQAFSPLNGVAAPGGAGADGGDRLLVRALAPADTPSALLGILIGTQPPLEEAADVTALPPSAPEAPSPATGQSVANFDTMLRVVDTFFEYWGWFGIPAPAPASPAPAPSPSTAAPPAEDGRAGGDDLSAVLPEADRPALDAAGPVAAALALAAGALLVPVFEHGKRSKTGRIAPADVSLPKAR
jgi:hypothetical protein